MRRTLAALAALTVLASIAAPAFARATKPTHETFDAQLAPFPNYSSITSTEKRGCWAGVENINFVKHHFVAATAGTLTAEVKDFTGDWDLAVWDGAGAELAYSAEDQTPVAGGAAADEQVVISLKAKQEVDIVPCNWLGAPTVTVSVDFVPTKIGTAKRISR
jgi:hypothetical protein